MGTFGVDFNSSRVPEDVESELPKYLRIFLFYLGYVCTATAHSAHSLPQFETVLASLSRQQKPDDRNARNVRPSPPPVPYFEIQTNCHTHAGHLGICGREFIARGHPRR